MVFHWSLSDSRSIQIFRIVLCNMANINNALVCIVFIRPLISTSFSHFMNLLGTVPRAPILLLLLLLLLPLEFFTSAAADEL